MCNLLNQDQLDKTRRSRRSDREAAPIRKGGRKNPLPVKGFRKASDRQAKADASDILGFLSVLIVFHLLDGGFVPAPIGSCDQG